MAVQLAARLDVPHHNRSVRRCRACFFVQRLAQIVDTPATAYRLAKWWRFTHGSIGEQPEQKWAAFLQGALPQRDLRGLLIAENSGLQDALLDPLWWGLSKLSIDCANREFWDSCAEAIEVNGAPLPVCCQAGIKHLCAAPSWTHLGFLLILLRSGSDKFAGYRAWLQRNFFMYFCIAALTSPIDRVAARLFRCINALVNDGSLAVDDRVDWPRNQQDFEAMLTCCHTAFELTHYRAWRNHWNESDDVHSLFWVLCQDAELCAEHLATAKEDEFLCEFGKRTLLSDRLRMRWRRTAERACKAQVRLAWHRCNQRVLPPSDRRTLHRLRLEADWVRAPALLIWR